MLFRSIADISSTLFISTISRNVLLVRAESGMELNSLCRRETALLHFSLYSSRVMLRVSFCEFNVASSMSTIRINDKVSLYF